MKFFRRACGMTEWVFAFGALSVEDTVSMQTFYTRSGFRPRLISYGI
jgi:hypothetical protein